MTFRQVSHFIKSFCVSYSLYKYKFVVLFKTDTAYNLFNKCFHITICILFLFALLIIYLLERKIPKKMLSCACALVLPISNKLMVFIHWEMFNFLILHLLLIYYNWIQLIVGDKADVERFFVKCTCSHVCVIVPLNEGACFFVCLLSALLAAIFVLETLFNML